MRTTDRVDVASLVAQYDQQTRSDGLFPVVPAEVAGQWLEVFDRSPFSLVEAFLATEDYADRVAVVYGDERYTYSMQWDIVHRLAGHLSGRFGVQPGDRIAVAMRNYPEWPFIFWASQLVGAVFVPLNAWLSAPELAVLIEDCDPAVIFADDERLARLSGRSDLLQRAKGVVSVRCAAAGAIAIDALVSETDACTTEVIPHRPHPEDIATILYTSGTTGRPKGVLGTHRNHTTTILSMRLRAHALRSVRATGSDDAVPTTPHPAGATLITFPLFHIAGLTLLTTNTYAGRAVVLMYKWDVAEAMGIIARERISEITGPPLIMRQTLEAALDPRYDASSLQTLGNGGAAASPKQVRDIVDIFDGDVVPTTGYGLTETTSAVLLNTGADFVNKPGSVGKPLPTVQIRVCDQDGRDLPTGVPGELWIRGPQVAAGYYGSTGDTAESFPNGWFRTGDQVVVDDDGFVQLVGRLKDVVIRGGENVYCAEVEVVLEDHPNVMEAAVIGRPHALLGEEIEAVVRLHPGHALDSQRLTEFVAPRLAAFKVPKYITFTDEPLPRNAAGKLVKRELTQRITGEAERRSSDRGVNQ